MSHIPRGRSVGQKGGRSEGPGHSGPIQTDPESSVRCRRGISARDRNTKVENPDITQSLYDRAIGASISVTPGELLAVSPDLRKLFVESCKVNRIPVYSVTAETISTPLTATSLAAHVPPLYTALIMELEVKLAGKYSEVGLYDTVSGFLHYFPLFYLMFAYLLM